MDSPAAQPLVSETVRPGLFAYVSVYLKAPAAVSTYEAFFKIRAPDGSTFGSGAGAGTAFPVKITVVSVLTTPSIQPILTPALPVATATVDPEAPVFAIQYIDDVTVPHGWEVGPDTVFTKTWRLRNTGKESLWNSDTLVFDHGDRMGTPGSEASVKGDNSAPPGGIFDVSLSLVSPSSPGTYQAFFKLFYSHGPGERNGSYGGTTLWAKIRVTTPTATPAGVPATVTQEQGAKNILRYAGGYAAAEYPGGSSLTGGGFGNPDNLDLGESSILGRNWIVHADYFYSLFSNARFETVAVCQVDRTAERRVSGAQPAPLFFL
ncbi:MAG: hypothetical protein JW748_12460 [Anaerolineales bacterium]|nr:hypothetical protein [Anaerolineales bacterium]